MHKNLNPKGIMFYFSMVVAIISVVLYQLLQKDISNNINPVVSLIITYTVAIILSLVLFFIFPLKENIFVSIKSANYASYLLGIAVVGIEIGFLLIYRHGWKLGLAAPFSSSVTNVVLIITSLILFKEQLSNLNILGLLFCIVGVFLVTMK